jgi:putative transposase
MIVLEFKLKGTSRQYQAIDEAIRTTQFIRNKCVHLWQQTHGLGAADLSAYCRILAQEHAFVHKLNAMARQAAAERAWAAISRFYRNCKQKKTGKKGYPRFQKNCRSVEYKTTGWKLDEMRRHLTLTDGLGMGTFKLWGTWDLLAYALGAIKRVRLLRRADGYYVQFAIDAERHVTLETTGNAVGIDLGLTHFYTDSDGHDKENPRFLRRSERALKRLGRKVSRKVKGSHNRAEARNRLARKHLQVQRQRRDFAAKTARALVMSNDVIAYEDLRVANMVKNRHLSKIISDAGWRVFLRWLEYLARVYDKLVVAVPPEYTTQECSRCGTLVKKTLSERTHVCPTCGLVLGRDHNAARTVLGRGLALIADQLPPGMAESHAWGERARCQQPEAVVGKAVRGSKNPTALAVWSVKMQGAQDD